MFGLKSSVKQSNWPRLTSARSKPDGFQGKCQRKSRNQEHTGQGYGQSRRTAALRAAARAITLKHPAWNGRASQFPHAAARRAAVRWREFVNGPAGMATAM